MASWWTRTQDPSHPKRESYHRTIASFTTIVIIAVYINRLKNLLLKTNCVTDRYPGLLYFYTTVSLDRLEFDS